MRIEITVILACPREHAWQVFDDPANLPRWQTSLKTVEPLAGVSGQVGTRTRLTYRESGRDITLIETVEQRTPSSTYRCRYESALMESTIHNTFTSPSPHTTSWTIVQETHFRGLLRLIGPLTRSITTSKFREDMARFKALAEQKYKADADVETLPSH